MPQMLKLNSKPETLKFRALCSQECDFEVRINAALHQVVDGHDQLLKAFSFCSQGLRVVGSELWASGLGLRVSGYPKP